MPMNSIESVNYKRLLLITLLLGLVVFYWKLGDIALMSFNEARRAIPIREMFASGDWLLPRLNGELYLTKPPLLYWLGALAAHVMGSASEWAVRLPSAIAATLIVWGCYRYALKEFGAWPALFTAQILIANAGFAMFARRAEIEMLLTALCVGALLTALHYARGPEEGDQRGRGWLYLSYFLLGLAMLTKGPLVLLFVTLPLLIVAIIRRQLPYWQAVRDPVGWLIFLVVGLSWYLVVTMQLGMDVWVSIIHRDMLEKMQDTTSKPFLSYMLWLLQDFLPVGLLLFIHPLATLRRWKTQEDLFSLLVAIAVPLLIFSFFSNKHDKYMLPIYPLVALLIGKRVGEIFEQDGPRLRRLIKTVGLLLPFGYAVFYAYAEPHVFDYRVSVFPKYTAWAQETKTIPLYGYSELDSRLIYYAGRNIQLLDAAALKQQIDTRNPMLLLVESASIDEVRPHADCLVREFAPYLKKNKVLAVFGFGAACQVPKTPAEATQ